MSRVEACFGGTSRTTSCVNRRPQSPACSDAPKRGAAELSDALLLTPRRTEIHPPASPPFPMPNFSTQGQAIPCSGKSSTFCRNSFSFPICARTFPAAAQFCRYFSFRRLNLFLIERGKKGEGRERGGLPPCPFHLFIFSPPGWMRVCLPKQHKGCNTTGWKGNYFIHFTNHQ